MRSRWLIACAVLSAPAVAVVRHESVAVRYGPADCVALSRSEQGSCVLTTHCSGVDTTSFEFAFLCVDEHGTEVKHTFGDGGFLEEEAYDTEVECAKCSPPDESEAAAEPSSTDAEPAEEPSQTAEPSKEKVRSSTLVSTGKPEVGTPDSAPSSLAASHALLTKFADSKTDAPSGVPPPHAAFYGPGGCVAAYRSPQGTCVMQTRCGGQDISKYEFGLNCIDSEGEITEHLFGKNSFDAEETFDTLVQCAQCVGLDEKAPQKLHALASSVQTLQAEMKQIQADVKLIKDKLAPEAEADGEAADAESDDQPAEDDTPSSDEEDKAAAEATADNPDDDAQGGALFLHHRARPHRAQRVRKVRRHVEEDQDLSVPEVADY